MISLLDAAARFAVMQAELKAIEHDCLTQATTLVQEEAKSVIGTYKYGWARLQAETIARKGADTPLLDTGALQDSIEATVDGSVGRVGTNDPKAGFHEFGTRTIPARSFLGAAAKHKEREVVKICRDAVGRVIAMTVR